MPSRAELSSSTTNIAGCSTRISCHLTTIDRHRELEFGPLGYVCGSPQAATVSFHNRSTDRQSHAHAVWFTREKSVEDFSQGLGIYSCSRIGNRDRYMTMSISFCSHNQRPTVAYHVLKSLDPVDDQIEADLLELDPISPDEYDIVDDFKVERDLMSLDLSARDQNDFPQRFSHVYCDFLRWTIFRHALHAFDDHCGAIGIPDDAIQRSTCAIDIRWLI